MDESIEIKKQAYNFSEKYFGEKDVISQEILRQLTIQIQIKSKTEVFVQEVAKCTDPEHSECAICIEAL